MSEFDDETSVIAAPEAPDGLPMPRRAIAIAAVLGAMIMVVLDSAIANVALPTLSRALHVTPAQSILVVTSYQIALVMALLPCAALGESIGYRKVYTGGVLLFVVASGFCAFSPSLPWLVAARFLQGLGGAATMALAQALIRFSMPHRMLGSAIGWNAMTVALSAAAGPTIGALILSVATWPWMFAVNLPVGALVLLATRASPESSGTGRPVDLISAGLNALTFGALVVAAELTTSRPIIAVGLFALTAIGLVALVRRESPRHAPLIPLDLLRTGTFRYSIIASVCCFAGQSAGMVALPFYLQHSLGQTPLTTGLYMTPWPLTVAFAAPLSGKLSGRFPTAWLCVMGAGCLALGLLASAIIPLHGQPLGLVPLVVLGGLGFGFFQTPNNRNMLLSAPRERSGAAGGMQATARLSGQTVGAVTMTVLFTLIPLTTAPRVGLAIGAGLAVTAGVVSLLRGAAEAA